MIIGIHARRSRRFILASTVAILLSAMTILALRTFIDDWFATLAVFGVAAVTAVSMVHPRHH